MAKDVEPTEQQPDWIKFKGRSVALFLPSLAGGGAERMMIRLAALLNNIDVVVYLIVCREEGEYLAQIPQGIKIVNLAHATPLRSVFALKRFLRANPIDALLSTLTHANYSALMATLLSGSNVRCIVRDAASPLEDLMYDSFISRHLKTILVRLLYPKAQARVALSEGVANGMRQAYGLPRQTIDVIYNPVDIIEIQQQSKMEIPHSWIQPPLRVPVLVSVGRLCFQKGFDILLRAIARLEDKNTEVRLIILGEGTAREDLKRLVSELDLDDRVDMPGFVTNPYGFIARATGFIFPSRWEGLGNALVEAMCCGTPIVATNCPHGPAEVLENGKHGMLIPVEDIDALAKAITLLLNHEIEPPKPSALNRFLPANILDKYLSVLFSD